MAEVLQDPGRRVHLALTTREGLEEIMALLITPTPGNGSRVACTGCSEGLTLTGFAASEVRAAVAVVDSEHRCAS